MTNKKIFPSEIMQYSVELHYQQRHTRSKIIYLTVLIFFIVAFISLFFIRVNVSVNSSGMLTAATERNIVRTPVNGQIEKVFVTENQRVETGDVLFTLQSDELEQQSDYLSLEDKKLDQQVKDLRQLVSINMPSVFGQKAIPSAAKKIHLKTPLYKQQYHFYRQKIDQAALTFTKEQTRHERQKQLYKQKVISAAEFDQSQYDFQNAQNQVKLLYDEQLSIWQGALHAIEEKMRDLHVQQKEFTRRASFYTVTARVNGTIQGLRGIRAGSFVSQGEILSELSPDSGLIAEIHVLPRDIGLLHIGMPTQFQVDAYNYNVWGTAHGNIEDISNDVYIPENGSPVFLVKCRLETKKLELPNGYIGTLKKGMGVEAHFLVARRTLFQLLYDNVSDWLDPASDNARIHHLP